MRAMPMVHIDFTANPFASPPPVFNWQDMTQRVRGQMTIKRGRGNELDRIEPGSYNLALDNSDRNLEPEYAAGIYYPNVLPMRRLRLQAVFGQTLYNLFNGWWQLPQPTWPDYRRGLMVMTGVDGFDALATDEITATLPFGLSGTQISSLLTSAGWPGATAIDAGVESMIGVAASISQPVKILDLIQQIAKSEAGIFFFDGAGRAVFHDRDHRLLNTRSTVTQATFGDGAPGSGEIPYLPDIQPDFDPARVFNQVERTSGLAGALPQKDIDAPSQLQYSTRVNSDGTNLLIDEAAAQQAHRILLDDKDPHLRFTSITVEPTRLADPVAWAACLGMELGDRVIVTRRPYGGGASISKAFYVESIAHSIDFAGGAGGAANMRSWRTTFSLSLADKYFYWRMGDATYGLLDTTTILR